METPQETATDLPAPRPSATPGIADGVVRPLDPRSVLVARIGGFILTACISLSHAIGAAIVSVTSVPGWVKLLVAALFIPLGLALLWISWRWPEIDHRHASYRVDGLGIEIRRGVFWRSVVNVARSRVQHTDVSQGPLERRYGLGTLKIHTAGTESAEVDLHGLAHDTALAIRDHLLRAGGDDAV